ncbi:hypothetical protein EW146_g1021 [Bondarzewia mesenterica]|uniref:DUF6534 domain-containing protein n=1 Tax=Bondarzewia mesenterica TaxID=1095465 RepID=A0A4S4M5N9_9AGAM|nr:hypothetical protein EW146_g1021 [Bondarzewia mesenterica]
MMGKLYIIGARIYLPPNACRLLHRIPGTQQRAARLAMSYYNIVAADAENVLPNFARTVQGPTLIGVFFNLMLYGIFLSQAHIYFSNYKSDQRWFKIFIGSLVILETVNSIFAMYYSYDRLVNNFGNMNAQAVSNWAFGISPLTNGIIGMGVQLFFAWRVRVLTTKVWAMVLIAFLSIISCLGAISIFFIAAILVPSPTVAAASFVRPVIIVWLVFSATADTLISTVMVYHLRKHKTGFVSTDDTIDKIIRLTVQTGLITSIWAIVDLGVYLGDPTAHHEIFNLALAKLYTNSLLSSLNARQGWKYNSSADNSGGRSMEAKQHRLGHHPRPSNAVNLAPASIRPEVFVNIESHELRDVALAKHPSDSTIPGDYRSSSDMNKDRQSF